jgi:hypothetical protein
MNEIITLTSQMKPNSDVESVKVLKSDLLRCYLSLPVKRIEDIINLEERVCIAAIARRTSDFQVNALLYFIVNDLVNFFNVGKTMNAEQIQQTVLLLREEYPYLTIEDLKICFSNAKKGLYGNLYDRIDGQIILDWVTRYDIKRASMMQDYHDRISFSFKEKIDPERQRNSEPIKLKNLIQRNLKKEIAQ